MGNEKLAAAEAAPQLDAGVLRQQSHAILAHATLGTATHAQMVRSPNNVRKKPRDLVQ